ncbi:MAG: GNAT family N-acetyltransferase [Anaerolineae bacterium]|nr:GNAT family N-acetyltransferase [Anaerolineae bacterium]
MTSSEWAIRPLDADDVPQLAQLDLEIESDWVLAVEKKVAGMAVTWRLFPQRQEPPFRSTHFAPPPQEWADLEQNLRDGLRDGFVAAVDRGPVAFIELGAEEWRQVGMVWNLLLHRPYRRQGIGTALMRQAIAWGTDLGLRALVLETQTNNWAALNFYRRMGFVPCGIDDHFYTNRDLAAEEVALFWYYELEDTGDE